MRATVAGGQGVNAARAMRALGAPVQAYSLVGRADLLLFGELLESERVPAVLVPVDQSTRHGLTLFVEDIDHPAAHSIGTGFTLTDTSPLDTLIKRLEDDIVAGDIIVLHGSCPPHLPSSTWGRIGKLVVAKGAYLMADIHGECLPTSLYAERFHICKINEQESSCLVADDITGDPAVSAALRTMAERGVSLPIVTRGSEGLRFLIGNEIWLAHCLVGRPRILVGAGDACMAGLAVAFARGIRDAADLVRWGVATAVAHIEGCEGSGLYSRALSRAPEVVFRLVEHF